MPISTKLTELAAKPLPKFVNPGMHGIIDWGAAAVFATAGALFWSRNKRASLASYFCADLIGSLIFLTDCPGGVWKRISFETHSQLDPGIAALVALIPGLLSFSDEKEARLFRAMGIGLAAVRSLTNLEEGASTSETRQQAA